MRDDVKTEQQQPPWPFTCYAHQRGEANDMLGDFSYEEVSTFKPLRLAVMPWTMDTTFFTQDPGLACLTQ